MNNYLLYFAFPLLFMLHELEEIAYMPEWFNKHSSNPKIPQFFKEHFNSKAKPFTLIVLEEYILILIIAVVCYLNSFYTFFVSLVIAYNVHIIVHLLQAIYLKTYVPGLVLGVISFVLLATIIALYSSGITLLHLAIFIPVCFVVLAMNLIAMHYFVK